MSETGDVYAPREPRPESAKRDAVQEHIDEMRKDPYWGRHAPRRPWWRFWTKKPSKSEQIAHLLTLHNETMRTLRGIQAFADTNALAGVAADAVLHTKVDDTRAKLNEVGERQGKDTQELWAAVFKMATALERVEAVLESHRQDGKAVLVPNLALRLENLESRQSRHVGMFAILGDEVTKLRKRGSKR